MIVGTTGTSRGPTPAQHDTFKELVARLPISRFVHGGCVGWDTLAHYAVRRAHPKIPIEIFPSDLHGMQGTCVTIPMGNCEIHVEMPPLDRNRLMTQWIYGLIAVPRTDEEQIRSGTWATIRYAREIGLPIYIIRRNGSIIREIEDRYMPI